MERNQPEIRLPKEPVIYIYTANITQEGTAAPTVVVLHNPNNLEITWTRFGIGNYRGVIQNWQEEEMDMRVCGQFTITQTFPSAEFTTDTYGNICNIRTSQVAYADDLLLNTPLEIRVYSELIAPLIP